MAPQQNLEGRVTALNLILNEELERVGSDWKVHAIAKHMNKQDDCHRRKWIKVVKGPCPRPGVKRLKELEQLPAPGTLAGKQEGVAFGWEAVARRENEEKGHCRGYSGHSVVKAIEVRL